MSPADVVSELVTSLPSAESFGSGVSGVDRSSSSTSASGAVQPGSDSEMSELGIDVSGSSVGSSLTVLDGRDRYVDAGAVLFWPFRTNCSGFVSTDDRRAAALGLAGAAPAELPVGVNGNITDVDVRFEVASDVASCTRENVLSAGAGVGCVGDAGVAGGGGGGGVGTATSFLTGVLRLMRAPPGVREWTRQSFERMRSRCSSDRITGSCTSGPPRPVRGNVLTTPVFLAIQPLWSIKNPPTTIP